MLITKSVMCILMGLNVYHKLFPGQTTLQNNCTDLHLFVYRRPKTIVDGLLRYVHPISSSLTNECDAFDRSSGIAIEEMLEITEIPTYREIN
ncbi:hypothetical protein EG68_08306 [Paragonimus skrjabini miyazakii]|uniref:Uncharacterized protein n=1 Tax=Paragonimus skrjabini miyazakii TaxID=59628 RepID=A0A8S9YWJ3_9TREM|nr:hypothetical protein EG68_08306 [Paragonimus skrjabini miyazakii]